MAWFDLDLSSKPYRTLQYHKDDVTRVAFHASFPLFASSSSDGSVHVFHGQVYQVRLGLRGCWSRLSTARHDAGEPVAGFSALPTAWRAPIWSAGMHKIRRTLSPRA